jgi:hypothetical protein
MELFVLLTGFAGSWLLFAGPIYQASLELKEEAIEIDHTKFANARRPKSVSAWWWFIPPVKIILERRRNEAVQKELFSTLSKSEAQSLVSFINKATAWQFVAIGGFCIALKETYELIHHLGWSIIFYWIIVVVLGIASISHVVIRSRRSAEILNAKE